MKQTIREKYNSLLDDLYKNYNKVKIIDNYDYYKSNTYTIFYLNNTESFDDFRKVWNKVLEENMSEDYDTILDEFNKKAKGMFDYVELGTLDICTREDYELEI